MDARGTRRGGQSKVIQEELDVIIASMCEGLEKMGEERGPSPIGSKALHVDYDVVYMSRAVVFGRGGRRIYLVRNAEDTKNHTTQEPLNTLFDGDLYAPSLLCDRDYERPMTTYERKIS